MGTTLAGQLAKPIKPAKPQAIKLKQADFQAPFKITAPTRPPSVSSKSVADPRVVPAASGHATAPKDDKAAKLSRELALHETRRLKSTLRLREAWADIEARHEKYALDVGAGGGAGGPGQQRPMGKTRALREEEDDIIDLHTMTVVTDRGVLRNSKPGCYAIGSFALPGGQIFSSGSEDEDDSDGSSDTEEGWEEEGQGREEEDPMGDWDQAVDAPSVLSRVEKRRRGEELEELRMFLRDEVSLQGLSPPISGAAATASATLGLPTSDFRARSEVLAALNNLPVGTGNTILPLALSGSGSHSRSSTPGPLGKKRRSLAGILPSTLQGVPQDDSDEDELAIIPPLLSHSRKRKPKQASLPPSTTQKLRTNLQNVNLTASSSPIARKVSPAACTATASPPTLAAGPTPFGKLLPSGLASSRPTKSSPLCQSNLPLQSLGSSPRSAVPSTSSPLASTSNVPRPRPRPILAKYVLAPANPTPPAVVPGPAVEPTSDAQAVRRSPRLHVRTPFLSRAERLLARAAAILEQGALERALRLIEGEESDEPPEVPQRGPGQMKRMLHPTPDNARAPAVPVRPMTVGNPPSRPALSPATKAIPLSKKRPRPEARMSLGTPPRLAPVLEEEDETLSEAALQVRSLDRGPAVKKRKAVNPDSPSTPVAAPSRLTLRAQSEMPKARTTILSSPLGMDLDAEDDKQEEEEDDPLLLTPIVGLWGSSLQSISGGRGGAQASEPKRAREGSCTPHSFRRASTSSLLIMKREWAFER